MGKKHHKISSRPAELSSGQLERQARDDMAAGHFRKARDTYKILCKQDREKYLPGLIEANRRLAEQLMERGLLSDAEQVLAYLKAIAPPSSMLAADVTFALKKHDWQRAFDEASRLCKDMPDALEERDRAAAADALVLAFPNVQESSRLPPPVASDLAAIVGALHCVCEERWEQAQELLRPVPRGSLFAAWKILVKGVIAFYAGDTEKAATLFAQLPPHGVPVRVASAFRLFLGRGHGQKFDTPADEQALKGACGLLDATNLAPFLLRADQSWRAARREDSYGEMRQAPGFPSEEPDLAGALSDFYLNAPFSMRDAAYDRYLHWFERLAASGRFKNNEEARLTYRMLGCAGLDEPFSELIERFWRRFLQFYPADDPLKPKVASLVLEQLGDYHAQRETPLPFFFGEEGERLRDVEGAIRLFQESIEHDPSNLGAYLKLLDVYERTEKNSERNRLLDRMAQLFPKEKAVLLRAGQECLKRKAYLKGTQYLERAHSLDALDPEVLQALVSAYTHLARQYYEKKNVNKGRDTFNPARRYAIRDQTDFVRGLDFLQALQGVLEMTFGDKETGLQLITAARECTLSPVALLLFAHGNRRLYRRREQSPFWAELLQSRAQVASPRARKDVFVALEYLYSLDKSLDWSAETAFVRECLAPLAAEAFTREEAWYTVPTLAAFPPFVSLAKTIIEEALRRHPDDPRFRLYSAFAHSRSPADFDVAELDKIYHDAMQEGDTKTAQVAGSAMEAARNLAEPPFEDDFGLPHDQLEDMRRAAAEMSDAEFEKFRKESSKFIPLPLFDLIMADVRAQASRGPQPERRHRGKRTTDQLELFNP
jgi:thioredoxin-like negative regulator of GroEL